MLSTGQINDAFSAVGRTPTQQQLTQYSSRGDLEGDPGKNALIKELGGSPAAPSVASTSFNATSPTTNPIDIAKQLIQTTQEANKPAIGTLQGLQTDLKQRYDDLVNSIKGAGTVAANRQTTITANELGARGILPNTTYGQQEISNALLPVNAAYAGSAAQVGLAGAQTQADIASQIAQLQSGNPAGAISNAADLYQSLYREVPYGGALYNTQTGSTVNSSGSTPLSIVGNNTTTVPSTTTTPKKSLDQIFNNSSSTGGVNYSALANDPLLAKVAADQQKKEQENVMNKILSGVKFTAPYSTTIAPGGNAYSSGGNGLYLAG